jgi:hypothetical protein
MHDLALDPGVLTPYLVERGTESLEFVWRHLRKGRTCALPVAIAVQKPDHAKEARVQSLNLLVDDFGLFHPRRGQRIERSFYGCLLCFSHINLPRSLT